MAPVDDVLGGTSRDTRPAQGRTRLCSPPNPMAACSPWPRPATAGRSPRMPAPPARAASSSGRCARPGRAGRLRRRSAAGAPRQGRRPQHRPGEPDRPASRRALGILHANAGLDERAFGVPSATEPVAIGCPGRRWRARAPAVSLPPAGWVAERFKAAVLKSGGWRSPLALPVPFYVVFWSFQARRQGHCHGVSLCVTPGSLPVWVPGSWALRRR